MGSFLSRDQATKRARETVTQSLIDAIATNDVERVSNIVYVEGPRLGLSVTGVIRIPGKKPPHQTTLLHIACAYDAFSVVDAILHQAPQLVHAVDSKRRTALHVAAVRSDIRCLRLLLIHGADRTARAGRTGPTPIEMAIAVARHGHGSYEAARVLLTNDQVRHRRRRRRPPSTRASAEQGGGGS